VRLADAALQFPLRHPAVVPVIPGGQGVPEMGSNVLAMQAPAPEALFADLEAEGPMRAGAPTGG
jgi:D-threo-aldose 1-dehydrogenase